MKTPETRPSISLLRTIFRLLQLRPHGSALLTESGAFWLLAVQLLVLVMALTEGISWGYLGFMLGEGSVGWLLAVMAGAIVFTVIFLLDASLVTVDRAYLEHKAALLDPVGSAGQRAWASQLKILLGVSSRIAIVVVSLNITAPFLAQMIFKKDITAEINTTALAEIDAARSTLRADFEAQIAAKQEEIARRRVAYEEEVAGTSGSGAVGEGPAAKAILHSIGENKAELSELEASRDHALSDFEAKAAEWQSNRDALTSYGVVLPEESIMSNRDAMSRLAERDEYRETELAIKAFLVFIFAGLLTLKLFEPSSIRLYMSEVLQSEYRRYRSGAFDDALQPHERSTGPNGISSQRLYEFLTAEWRPSKQKREARLEAEAHRKEMAQRRKEEREHAIAERQRIELEARRLKEKKNQEAELEKARKQKREAERRRVVAQNIQHLKERLATLEVQAKVALEAELSSHTAYIKERDSYQKLQSATELVEGHVQSYAAQYEKLQAKPDGIDLESQARFESHVREQLTKAEAKLHHLKNDEPTQRARVEHAQQTLSAAKDAREMSEGKVRALQDELETLQNAMLLRLVV